QALASASLDGEIRLWDTRTGQELHRIRGEGGGVYSVAGLPGGQRLLAGGEDGLLRVWDCATGSLVAAYPAHPSRVYAVAVSPDGRLAASGGADGELRVWDLTPSGVMRCRFTAKESAAVRCLAFARDGEVVAAGYEDGVVALRNSSGHLVPML